MSSTEVEELVQRLYLPGSPQEISKIQQTLQSIQRSQDGWQLADVLLQSHDKKVRFFGALTFSIKINTDWDSLGDDNAPLLLGRLLSWLVKLVATEESPLVVRKLCSTLVAYFMQPKALWISCVRHVLCCFYVNTEVPSNSLDQQPSTIDLISGLSEQQIITTLWFVTSLIEEVSKTSSDSLKTHKYHERIASCLDDSVNLFRTILRPDIHSNNRSELTREGIKCYQSWVIYAHRAYIEKILTLDKLREVVPQAIHSYRNDDLWDEIIEFLTDVLTNFPAFFTNDHFELMSQIFRADSDDPTENSERTASAATSLRHLYYGNFEEESVAFGRFLLAYGDAKVQDLAHDSEDKGSTSRYILDLLTGLMNCEGFAVAEDEICSQALEFWTTYVEYLIDAFFETEEGKPAWLNEAKGYVWRIIEACWVKIRSPPHDIYVTWDSEARVGFKTFRADVEDFLQSSYTLLGLDVFHRFGQLALASLDNRAWLDLEATLFCINALSDAVANEQEADKILSALFSSCLFDSMADSNSPIRSSTQQMAVAVLNRYTAFFERHTDYLPAALNFLFGAVKSLAMTDAAAKAISAMCSSCRVVLVPELKAFMQQYEALLTWTTMNPSTKERIIGAITAIVQALPDDEAKLDPLHKLLEFVERDVHECLNLLEIDQPEEAQSKGHCALRCLVNIGKGLQSPDDVAIDLDAEKPKPAIWEVELGLGVQNRIIQYLSVLFSRMSWNGEIVESTCQILRVGYIETSPGPFAFPLVVTEEIVLGTVSKTARLGYVLDTAGILLSKHTSDSSTKIEGTALLFLKHSLRLIHGLDLDPTNDPEVASGCVNLVERFLPRYLDILFSPQTQESIPSLLTFVLRCLTTPEILSKRSAANFWSSFLAMKNQPFQIQNTLDAAIQQYGPLLSQILIRGIGGDAARSELDTLAEPLKKLVQNQPKAKVWLGNTMFDKSFPSQTVNDTEKRLWLQKIISLRGSRGTNQAVKEFWMACRGTNLVYTS